MKNRIDDRYATRWFGRLVRGVLSNFELKILSYYKKFDREAVQLLRSIWKEEKGTVAFSPYELFQLYTLAKVQNNVEGDFAEVGVFRGASAKVIASVKSPQKPFYLFDTFTGLPETGDSDDRFSKNTFAYPKDAVEKRLENYDSLFFYEGLFPRDTSDNVADKKFALVHLDVDLYQSTLDALDFFWPRVSSGGVIISHDYSQCEGVNKAFKEFIARIDNYRLIELPSTQVILMKD